MILTLPHNVRHYKSIIIFMLEIGFEYSIPTSRNPLESPWAMDESGFKKLAKKYGTPDVSIFKSAREETMSLTEETVRVEGEIDEMVRSLYGV